MRILFMGTPEIAAACLEKLLPAHEVAAAITRQDKPKGRGKTLSPPPVKELCIQHGIECYQPLNLRNDEAFDYIKSVGADIIVVVAYGRLLPKEVLELPRYGCVNLHCSLLPKYRGAAPMQWAIINGETETGLTTMLMDEGIDTGDILEQIHIPIPPEMTSGDLFAKSGELGGDLLLSTIEGLHSGSITPIKQQGESTHAPLLTKELEKINWSSNARDIVNLVRGLSPAPYCYFISGGKKVKVAKAYATEASAPAGTLINASADGITIAAGSGSVRITHLQPEGKRVMTADEFLRGNKISDIS